MDSKKKKSPCNLGCFCQYLSISLSVSCCFGYCGFIGHFVIWWGKSPLSASYSFLPSEFLGSAHMFSLPEEFKNQLVKFQNLPTEILMEIALNWHHYNTESSHQEHVIFQLLRSFLMSLKFSSFLHIYMAYFSKCSRFSLFLLWWTDNFFPFQTLSFCKGFVLVQVLMVALYRHTLKLT